jgi:DNA-binding MarR family transcriptional regulator
LPARPGRDLAEVLAEWQSELGEIPMDPLLIALLVQRLSQYIEREFTTISRAYDIGPGDMRILFALARTPGHVLTPKSLFQQLLITSGAVSKQADRLATRGLVSRTADPDILRGVLIKLEPAGHKIATEVTLQIVNSFCGLEHLSAAKQRRIVNALQELQGAMEETMFESTEPDSR